MAKGKSVLTTGDVSRICKVAPRTVSKWFDNGHLKGYRIPGSKDRRIPLSELVRFMKANNMPTDHFTSGNLRVLIADSDSDSASRLARQLCQKSDYEVEVTHSTFQTGIAAQKFVPHVLLVNLLNDGIDVNDICQHIRADEELRTIRVIAITNTLSETESAALLQKGFDSHICDPSDINSIIEQIEHATAVLS